MGVILIIGVIVFIVMLCKKGYEETVDIGQEIMDNFNNSNQVITIPMQIYNADPSFNTNNISSYDQPKKFIYRPEKLEEYIGQEIAKQQIRLNVKKINKFRPVHFLISGTRGCGKTTIAHIIKNELKSEMIEKIAGEITNPEQVEELFNQINETEGDNPILFIDEIHSLKANLCETFYSAMEDFKVSGNYIKPFILIGATTEKNILVEKVAPFVDRFQVIIELERYSEDDISNILKQYKQQLYPEENIKEKNITIISKNCKFTPRIAISMLEDNLIEKNIQKVLTLNKIVKDGLTTGDIKIFQLLLDNPKAIGGNTIAMAVDVSVKDYNTIYEPYLVSQRFILRTRQGRLLSEKGKKFMEGLKND